MMMPRKDDAYNKVMKGLKSTKGLTKTQRAELDRLKAMGEKQAAADRARRNNQTKALNKKAEREYEKRWKGRGGDDVVDTGMFR
jgi:hypothetical protein